MSDEPEYLTIPEAAHLLRVPVSWVYSRTKLNALAGLRRVGKYCRINRRELLEWIERQGQHNGHR